MIGQDCSQKKGDEEDSRVDQEIQTVMTAHSRQGETPFCAITE